MWRIKSRQANRRQGYPKGKPRKGSNPTPRGSRSSRGVSTVAALTVLGMAMPRPKTRGAEIQGKLSQVAFPRSDDRRLATARRHKPKEKPRGRVRRRRGQVYAPLSFSKRRAFA
jgi:hypothetical protein